MTKLAVAISLALYLAGQAACSAGGLLDVNYRKLVAHADLTYSRPIERSVDGIPIGNGRMGTLLWTTPAALKMQINRVDVFANGNATNSFPERHADYCGGCGFVDIDFSVSADEVFSNDGTSAHLSCYEGLAALNGRGIEIQALAWTGQDVMAIQIEDRREKPDAISVNLRMLRPPEQRTRSHLALSKLEARDGRIILTQKFTEDDYYCGSAVVVGLIGRDARARQINDDELRLIAPAGKGVFTILIASAAGFDKNLDIVADAQRQLDAAVEKGFAGLADANKTWWGDYWAKSFVHLHSDDGVADMIEQNYTYYLYIMACCSRGKYPAKFNGMLWAAGGDTRRWGGQYWGANQSCLYNNALLAANQVELTDPMFDMYSGMLDSCALAARQQWGSAGIFIPETVGFDGVAPLPDDIAAEMRDLYLLKKPWDARSNNFLEFASTKMAYASRWNWIGPGKWVQGRWIFDERGGGPYGPVSHIFSRGAKIAYQYWLRYEYTQDENWLRLRVYPMLKGVAEFYRNYPNVKKGADGKYHIHHVNSNEPLWGGQDTDEEIASMMGVIPVVIRASEILDVDSSMRPVWKEFLENLATLPRSDNPAAPSPNPRAGPPIWIKGLEPVVRGRAYSLPDGNTLPMWFFDLCTLESKPDMLNTANATLDAYFRGGVGPERRVGVLSKIPLAAAILGRADAVKYLIPNQIETKEVPVLLNRMDLREGKQTTSAQRLGNAADALHMALCQDLPAAPGKAPVIRVFAAWPKQWDAEFTLLARGSFLVTSSIRQGKIEFVELQSQAGVQCRLRNPWKEGFVTLFRNGKKSEDLNGSLLRFDTAKGENIIVVRASDTSDQYKRNVLRL
jgi:Glycosyl hydrolase family 95 catalytic domain